MVAANRSLRLQLTRFAVPAFLFAATGSLLGATAQPVPNTPAQTAFFEEHIRPALVENCYQCHSADAQKTGKLKGGLFLDTRAGTLKGGDTGPALTAGKPEESLLVKAIRWADADTQMPPKKRLPAEIVTKFEQWIAMGAPDPREGVAGNAKREINIATGKEHWAFKRLSRPEPPTVQNTRWAHNEIDRFILAAQEAASVHPAPPASRATLVRRAYFDLLGLPPKPEDVESFVRDEAPDAFARLVDKLLQSPQYGERWGRHWLDVVRFAESGGYEFDGFRPGAYFYRDWVIRSLNTDLPYDEFVRQQLAGDETNPDKVEGASATGFLVAGPYPGQITAKTVERIRYDQLDDMLSTAGSAMLGLTIGCVRCHDHKYDPIPQVDYYNLAATLARTEHGEIKLERSNPEADKIKAAHAAKNTALLGDLQKFASEELPALFLKWADQQKAQPAAQADAPWKVFDVLGASADKAFLEPAKDGLVVYTGNKTKDDVYTVKVRTYQRGIRGFRLEALSDPSLPKKGPGLSDNGNFVLGDFKATARPLDPALKAKPFQLKLNALKASFEQKNYPLSNAVDNNPQTGWAIDPQQGNDQSAVFGVSGDPAGFENGTEIEFQLRFSGFYGLGRFRISFCNTPEPAPLEAAAEPQDRTELSTFAALGKTPEGEARTSLARWFARFDSKTEALVEPLRAHERKAPKRDFVDVYSTKTGGRDVFLLKRGEVDNKAAKADPGFIQVLSATGAEHWTASTAAANAAAAATAANSPRVALGRWMTDPEQGAGHLLARVLVNRVWQHHFGRALVATPNDFGVQGEKPSHPELLDYLASRFIESGWKLKELHRLLLLSAAYQQGAETTDANRRNDPDNKLVWRQPARRLEAEAIRDSLLSAAGTLDLRQFGPSDTKLESLRRSVYLRVRRSELVPFLTLFDAPEALQSMGERGLTTMPTQALTLLNSPFVRDCATKLAARALADNTPPEAALEKVFCIALGRPSTAADQAKFGAYFKQLQGEHPTPQSTAKALALTCHVLLCTNEFVYVD